ncbi:MAG: HAMP domain-containing histidine kinase [Dehalococcoidia bacterium]|nr:HAMP domain-containing histidine kinase [Dehalococcoidia bacterium]
MLSALAQCPPAEDEEESHRREAMGAFAHELRTPLTSMRMVVELGRREAGTDGLRLDAELTAMLEGSLDHLQQLADDLQEVSRLERRRLFLSAGPCDLRAAIAAAAELVGPRVLLKGELPPPVEGPWDVPRLVRALAGFCDSANRAGDGSGTVRLAWKLESEAALCHLSSGEPAGESRPLTADAGFGFFRSRLVVLAMGGSVAWERRERHFAVEVRLPLA